MGNTAFLIFGIIFLILFIVFTGYMIVNFMTELTMYGTLKRYDIRDWLIQSIIIDGIFGIMSFTFLIFS